MIGMDGKRESKNSMLLTQLLDDYDLTSFKRFLQLKQNFFNHLITLLQSTALSPFAQQMFPVAFMSLWPS